VLSRPAVEAGEKLGYLPGDLKEKVDPYLRPLYDALHDMMPAEQLTRRMAAGEIEVAPLAFMRGRTLAHCYAILDEAQNTTPAQMKMFLTRMGEGSRMVVTGDPTQVDLPPGQNRAWRRRCRSSTGVDGISVARFAERDVVRHPLVARIVAAYGRADQAPRAAPNTGGPAAAVAGRVWREMEPGSRRPGRKGKRPEAGISSGMAEVSVILSAPGWRARRAAAGGGGQTRRRRRAAGSRRRRRDHGAAGR
jgi:phosphate starvation-inducible PhoH-like protein